MRSDVASQFLVLAFFWMIACSSNMGFMAKWAFRDNVTTFNMPAMLEGTAMKPMVYRLLIPTIANEAQSAHDQLPGKVKEKIDYFLAHEGSIGNIYGHATNANDPAYIFRYEVVYHIGLLCLFFSLIILRKVLLELDFGQRAAVLAPSVFLIAWPYILTKGGYFYDSSELLFMSIAFLFALRCQYFALIALTPLATYNKESFLFFLVTLLPVLAHRGTRARSVVAIAVAMGLSMAVNLYVKSAFRDASGGMVWFQLPKTLLALFLPSTYVEVDSTYGELGPRGFNVLSLVVLVIVLHRGWGHCALFVRRHLQIGMVISVPLYLLFCREGEIRNFSFVYIGFVVILANAVQYMNQPRATAVSAPPIDRALVDSQGIGPAAANTRQG